MKQTVVVVVLVLLCFDRAESWCDTDAECAGYLATLHDGQVPTGEESKCISKEEYATVPDKKMKRPNNKMGVCMAVITDRDVSCDNGDDNCRQKIGSIPGCPANRTVICLSKEKYPPTLVRIIMDAGHSSPNKPGICYCSSEITTLSINEMVKSLKQVLGQAVSTCQNVTSRALNEVSKAGALISQAFPSD